MEWSPLLEVVTEIWRWNLCSKNKGKKIRLQFVLQSSGGAVWWLSLAAIARKSKMWCGSFIRFSSVWGGKRRSRKRRSVFLLSGFLHQSRQSITYPHFILNLLGFQRAAPDHASPNFGNSPHRFMARPLCASGAVRAYFFLQWCGQKVNLILWDSKTHKKIR